MAAALLSTGLSILLGLALAESAWALPTTPFLSHYWQWPLALSRHPQPAWPAFERRLSAKACALCHEAQARAWRRSRHAQAMGPGVIAQLAVAGLRHKAFIQGCLSCHAPGGRQWRDVRAFLVSRGPLKGLARQGVTCADCHVRHERRFGPPLAPYIAAGDVVHGGFTPESVFTRSRFCAVCHQFHKNGARLDGVLLENTYQEWRASRYARQRITCQSCHMPDGRHTFSGIHNPRFVRRALTIRFSSRTTHGTVQARLSVTNSGVGHDFPTYTTPEVIVTVREICAHGVCPGSTRRLLIGRRISLNLRHQVFDTRIPPGAARTLHYQAALAHGATALQGRIVVEPDAAYLRFFRAYLVRYALNRGEHRAIVRALARDRRSAYVLWSRTRALR